MQLNQKKIIQPELIIFFLTFKLIFLLVVIDEFWKNNNELGKKGIISLYFSFPIFDSQYFTLYSELYVFFLSLPLPSLSTLYD